MNTLLRHIMLLAATLLLAACAGESARDDEEALAAGNPGEVTVRLMASSIDGGPEDHELINSWWLAFVGSDDKIVKILSQPVTVPPSPKSEVKVTTRVPAGTYRIYAFANFSDADPSTAIFGLTEGSVLPAGFEDNTWSVVPDYDNLDLVPMTGKVEGVGVHPRESENVVVEVVRLVGKMQFQFQSESTHDLALKAIHISNAANPAWKLFPNYKSLDHGSTILPEIIDMKALTTFTRTLAEPISLRGTTATFYLPESSASGHPTGHYVLTFDVVDRADNSVSTLTALAYQIDFINRNDFYTIPVKFTDRNVELVVRFYPPIGGYPAVLTESRGNEFFATFRSAGVFMIVPKVTDYEGNEYAPASYTIDIDVESDPGHILLKQPERDVKSLELVGELASGAYGTAVVNLTFNVEVSETLKYQILRKLYIISTK